MKMLDNSAQYANFTDEQLNNEINKLQKARELALETGTGAGGVDRLIESANLELNKRTHRPLTNQELIDFADNLEENGHLRDQGPIADKQKEAPGNTGEYYNGN